MEEKILCSDNRFYTTGELRREYDWRMAHNGYITALMPDIPTEEIARHIRQQFHKAKMTRPA